MKQLPDQMGAVILSDIYLNFIRVSNSSRAKNIANNANEINGVIIAPIKANVSGEESARAFIVLLLMLLKNFIIELTMGCDMMFAKTNEIGMRIIK